MLCLSAYQAAMPDDMRVFSAGKGKRYPDKANGTAVNLLLTYLMKLM